MNRGDKAGEPNKQLRGDGEEFAAFVDDPSFPCLGAKAALNSGSYRIETYNRLADPVSTKELAVALESFQKSELRQKNDYATFIAIFREPRESSEEEFEKLLWSQLQQLHAIDRERYSWDPSVSSNLSDPYFSFSFAGKALYVIGMHPNSSRLARRFPRAALIFNPHEQFERLRHDGKWAHLREVIRQRDVALQGSANPMLADFGEASEARQYSGRAVDESWEPEGGRCPFGH